MNTQTTEYASFLLATLPRCLSESSAQVKFVKAMPNLVADDSEQITPLLLKRASSASSFSPCYNNADESGSQQKKTGDETYSSVTSSSRQSRNGSLSSQDVPIIAATVTSETQCGNTGIPCQTNEEHRRVVHDASRQAYESKRRSSRSSYCERHNSISGANSSSTNPHHLASFRNQSFRSILAFERQYRKLYIINILK